MNQQAFATNSSAYCIACRVAMNPISDRDGWWTCRNVSSSAHGIPRPEGLTAATADRHRTKKHSVVNMASRRPVPWRQAERTSKRPPVLVINGYAGSLVLAATSIGCDVVGSYEHDDRAKGIEVQRMNFTHLSYANSRRSWPNDDLAGVVVVAHPPCAAFSKQNRTTNRGTDASTFAMTTDTLGYAMGQRADAVLLESVVGAFEGAKAVHDQFACRYGYRLYRVLQNASTFGVPQHRERFWAVFVREGVTPEDVWFYHQPRRCTVGDVLDENPSRPIGAIASRVKRQREVLFDALGPLDAERVMSGEFGFGTIRRVIASARGCRKLSADDERRLCLNGFRSDHINVLDPNGVSSTLLKNSTWVCRGRALSAAEYKRVMGFPDSYRFPVDDWRPLITKGVCPPVAAWLLDQVLSWIEGVTPAEGPTWVQPGGVLDIRDVA